MKKEVVSIRKKAVEKTKLKIANFEEKVSGSSYENPHIAKAFRGNAISVPSTFTAELGGSDLNNIKSLDGSSFVWSSSTNGYITQVLFSFNLIEHVKRKYGLSVDAEWLKRNVSLFTCNWYGKGNSATGAKATIQGWYSELNKYLNPQTHTSSSVTKLTWGSSTISDKIDNEGYIHFVVYAEPSDGITASVIETDYIELQLELIAIPSIRERLKDNGTVQEIRVRFYPGVERALKIAPYILHKGSKREDLFTYPEGAEMWITGDNDYFVFPVSIDFEYDDFLIVEYQNEGNYPYTLAIDIIVAYYREETV